MKLRYPFVLMLVCTSTSVALADSPAVTKLLSEYAAQGASNPTVQQGEQLWSKKFKGAGKFPERSCSACHTTNLKQAGRHVKTKKVIEPMAPSVNAERLSSTRDIKKWFKRNCKWTLGRECTASEKASLLTYIKQQ